MPNRTGHPYNRLPTTEAIRRHFRENPGRTIWLDELKTLLKGQLADRQIVSAIYNSRMPSGPMDIEIVSPGHGWMYTPPALGHSDFTRGDVLARADDDEPQHPSYAAEYPKATAVEMVTSPNGVPRIFVEKMTTKKGVTIVEDHTGDLYVLSAIDL